ncbi:MAG TPA: diacylglycerol kinase family protein [Anaerolineales bacterium]|nr:diacylglycerol kinase family protein [Anaerolineales bacterium]
MSESQRSTSRLRSFRYAFAGMVHVLRTQRNAWIHGVMTVVVVALGLWLRIDSGQWPPLLLAVALVWMAEFINSALEAIVDLASPGRHPLARVGKDVGAAAVLIAALAAAAVGLIVLLPPLTARLGLAG